ncbi:MAG: phosphatase PAP2 family protein [Oscillospiraceae bacterium]
MGFITALDTEILWILHNALQSHLLDRIMMAITSLGNAGILWIVLAVVLLCHPRTRRIGMVMALSLLLCFFIGNLCIKPLIARPRPYLTDPSILVLIDPGDPYSFPSGHAMSSFAAAVPLTLYRRKWGGWALLVATLIAFSRLYLMVHYPTDVLAGMLIGSLVGILVYWGVEHVIRSPNAPRCIRK